MLVASTVSLAGQATCLAATSVNLQWGASSGATGYKLYYQADSATQPFKGTGAAQGASPVNVGNVTSATLSGLDPSRNYYAAVTAFNSAGESAYSNVVTIPESVAPTVSITAPANGSTATGTVSVTANATDNIGVTKVEFYVNGALAATDTATPYLYSWSTSSLAAGTYTLMAKAYDAAGNVGQSSTISVSVVKDTTAPTVSLTSPASGSTLSGTTTISASATDNIGISKVEFYANGTLLGATNVSPYSYSWNTATMTNGSYTLTAKAYDAAGNVATSGSATVQTSNSVLVSATSGIWSASTVPGLVDSGPDSSVELGVKFRSDVNGYINGIRFYKASTNTGTHVGTLWSSTGTKLASATFSNETASGWQQVNFSTPVAITANTVYVASYHTSAGHYSDDQYFFSGKSVDNAPLHALADGTSGANGVYAYGSSTIFPNQGFNSSNYWVDVAFSTTSATPAPAPAPAPAPTLSSISVTPASQTMAKGATVQYTATGTYSDGSTKTLTATWTSSNTAVATIGSTGLANAIGAGSSTITATAGGMTKTASLTVSAPTTTTLAITTSSLPGATQNGAYSATLTASGGTAPYAWSIASGSLPSGLTLNGSTGAISGTPTASGTFSLTVSASDSSSTKQTSTKALSLAVAAATTTTTNTSLWSATTVPSVVDSGPDSSVELGVRFRSDVSGYITGIRFYKASTNTGTHVASLWTAGGTKLASATFTNETGSGWQQVNFATPVAISANTSYIASYHTNAGHYSDDQYYFSGKSKDTAPLHAPADGTYGYNGVYAYGSSSLFPNQGFNSSNYWVDVVFHP